jgi:hypothetical protein
VLCLPRINVALLNLTANVVVRKLQAELAQPLAQDPASTAAPTVDRLRRAIHTVLGEHASRVLPMLSGDEESVAELLQSCDRIERATRLFIDGQKAAELGKRMRDIISQ